MRVDIIEGKKALADLRADWDAVYEADPEAQFFLSSTWMFRWLTAIEKPWCVLAAAPDATSPYVAFFPLWLDTSEHKAGGFYNGIQMGGNAVADYTGFICRPEHDDRAIPAFAERIKQLNWAELRLEFLRASDRRTTLFMQAFPAGAFAVSEIDRLGKDNIDNSRCPFATLPDDWDTYLETRLSANMRQKVRRLLRQIEKSDEFRITHADDKDSFERDLEILLRFWTDRWGSQKRLRLNSILKNNRLMLRHCFANESLFLPVLWQGERPVGVLATLVDARKRSFLFHMAGRDQAFEGPQPGLVLHAHSIRHAIRNGFATYDFMRGNEAYKYSFGVEELRVTSFVLATKDGKNLGGVLDPRSLPFVLRTCMEHQRAGRLDQADAGFRQVLELDPHNVEALYGRGRILAKRGQHPAAIALFQTLLGAKPDTARAWFWLGRSLRARGEFAPAVLAYCEGIERQPAMAGAYHELGQILIKLGQFDRAVAAFDAARRLQADLPDIDISLTSALQARAKLSPAELARRASRHPDVSDRVGRLRAIAAAAEREAPATAPARNGAGS